MSLARAASAFVERRPNATTVAAAMARGAAGDACAQRAEDHGTWDARRCATFMMWSTGVAFALDRYVYSHLFALWWPRTCVRNVLRATAADNAIVTPCLYFPCFYAWQAACEGNEMRTAAERYRAEAVVQLPTTWAFWVPANVVTFSIAPHLRTVWSGAAGTLYVGLLSYVAHAYR